MCIRDRNGTLLDGIDGSYANYSSSAGVSSVTTTGVVIEISESLNSSDEAHNYDIDHEILIPFDKSGNLQIDDVRYKWKWIKLKPNNRAIESHDCKEL